MLEAPHSVMVLISALVFKLYTEYWKDATIKRRYEKQDANG